MTMATVKTIRRGLSLALEILLQLIRLTDSNGPPGSSTTRCPWKLPLHVSPLDKIAEHLPGHFEVGDHPVFQWLYHSDLAWHTRQHVFGLSEDRLHFPGAVVEGEMFVSRSIWNGRISDPKTRKGRAPVPVIRQLADRLEIHRLRYGSVRLLARSSPMLWASRCRSVARHPSCAESL